MSGRPLGVLVFVVMLGAPLGGAGVLAQHNEQQVTRRSLAGCLDPAALAGTPLTEALERIAGCGWGVVSSSELVRADMAVLGRPSSEDPELLLEEILAPHGLHVRVEAGGTWVVVRGPPPPVALAGRVLAAQNRVPLPGVAVRVFAAGRLLAEGRSDGDGRFLLPAVAAGAVDLDVQRYGFLPYRLARLPLIAGMGAVEIELHAAPTVVDEIAVRAGRVAILQETVASPLGLSRRQVESLPHLGSDPLRALSLMPGTAANDRTARFSLQGGRRDEVLILLDGQELYDAFHLKDYDEALSLVSASSLEGVELTTGTFAATYGDRMGGVLDLTTSAPGSERRYVLSLSVLNALALASGSGGEATSEWIVPSWMVSLRRGSIDLATRAVGQEDPSFWDGLGKVEWQLGARHQLRLRSLLAADRLDFGSSEEQGFKRFDTDYQSAYLWATHQAIVSDRVLLESSASQSWIERERLGSEQDDELGFLVTDRRDHSVSGLEQRWSWQVAPRHAVQGGWELRSYDADYAYRNRVDPGYLPPSDQYVPRGESVDFDGRLIGDHYGFWLSDQLGLGERWSAELGLRLDRHPLTGDTLWSPRLHLGWQVGERSVVRMSAGDFHQSHRAIELDVEDGQSLLSTAERARHYVLGFEHSFGARSQSAGSQSTGSQSAGPRSVEALRVELYQRRIENPRPRGLNLYEPANSFAEVEPDRARVFPEAGTSRGAEVVVSGALGHQGHWWASYAWARILDRVGGDQVPRSLDQPHTLNAVWSVALSTHWSLDLAFRYHTGWPTTPIAPAPEGSDYVVEVGRLNSERLPDYHRMDLRVSRRWPVKRGELLFFVDVQNLYNRSNLAGLDVVVDAETGSFVSNPEFWAGLFPSVGITWEF